MNKWMNSFRLSSFTFSSPVASGPECRAPGKKKEDRNVRLFRETYCLHIVEFASRELLWPTERSFRESSRDKKKRSQASAARAQITMEAPERSKKRKARSRLSLTPGFFSTSHSIYSCTRTWGLFTGTKCATVVHLPVKQTNQGIASCLLLHKKSSYLARLLHVLAQPRWHFVQTELKQRRKNIPYFQKVRNRTLVISYHFCLNWATGEWKY